MYNVNARAFCIKIKPAATTKEIFIIQNHKSGILNFCLGYAVALDKIQNTLYNFRRIK